MPPSVPEPEPEPVTMHYHRPWDIQPIRPRDQVGLLLFLQRLFPEKHFRLSFFWNMSQTWVARDLDGNIIGTSSARLNGPDGQLHWIGVAETERGKGLAHALCTRALSFMLDRGAALITVKQNPATEAGTALYKSLGFA